MHDLMSVRAFYDGLAPRYHLAITMERVAGLMREVGFDDLRRLDGRFFQPVLVGTRH